MNDVLGSVPTAKPIIYDHLQGQIFFRHNFSNLFTLSLICKNLEIDSSYIKNNIKKFT